MKEHWQEQLLKIEDLAERRLLRDVLLAAFEQLETYTNEQLGAIKQRVFEESKLEVDQFDIYTSLVSIDDYNPIHEGLFPMKFDDLKELPFDATVIAEQFETSEKPKLGKLYVELDYLALRQIQKTLPHRTFKGQLKTSRAHHDIEISLSPDTSYVKQIEKLYELYLENNIPWKTVLHPSIYKLMAIQLETQMAFKKHEKIEEMTFNLEELEPYKQINPIPLWNIKTQPFNSQGFSMPAADRVNYDHVLTLEDNIREISYLVERGSVTDRVIQTRRSENKLILTSAQDLISNWQLWLVIKPLEKDLSDLSVTSNGQIESFIHHLASRTGRTVRTLGEIYRLAHSFVDAVDLKLVEIVKQAQPHTTSETYDLNPFIKDEIRTDVDKKIIKLKFRVEQLTPFTRDVMSFLTSEINLYFPEYQCVGELI